MALTTYDELKMSICSWLNRDDLDTYAADFVTLGEARLNRDVHHWKGDTRQAITVDSRFIDMPSDLIEINRIVFDVIRDPLYFITASEMQELRAARADASGIPQYMALIADKYEIFPTPTASYSGFIYYRAQLPALSDSNTTNWLLDLAPDAYLYACLISTAPFLKDDDRLGVWTALYQEAVQTLNNQSERASHGGNLKMRIGAPGRTHAERH